MSARRLFVFVEGRLDRYFFDRVCAAVVPGDAYELASAQDLPDIGSGKDALLALYQFLSEAGSLSDDFEAKRSYVLLFLDKDVDDVRGALIRSPHVIYTAFYDLENHLFASGDLVGAIASAAEVGRHDAARALGGDAEVWRRRVAENWKLWVTLCVCAVLLDQRDKANFRLQSKVNQGVFGDVSVDAEDRVREELFRAAGTSEAEFGGVLKRARAVVDARYASDACDTVFRGKWYEGFVRHAVTTASPPIKGVRRNGLEDRLVSVLAYSVAPVDQWTDGYRKALVDGLAWCGSS